MQRSRNGHLRLADRPADYKELGIAPVEVAGFEDGQRIDTERGRYEWWYFDSHLDNGATVVVVFGWSKTVGGLTQVKVRGIEKVRAVFVLAMAAYNIVRLPKLLDPRGELRPQT